MYRVNKTSNLQIYCEYRRNEKKKKLLQKHEENDEEYPKSNSNEKRTEQIININKLKRIQNVDKREFLMRDLNICKLFILLWFLFPVCLSLSLALFLSHSCCCFILTDPSRMITKKNILTQKQTNQKKTYTYKQIK